MKNFKRIAGILLALILAMSMMTAAFAEATETGSITINNIADDTVYEVYQMLDLESYDKNAGAYSYKVNSAWKAFFDTTEAKNYMTVDPNGYVTWSGAKSDADVAAFAKLALAYAKANGIAPVQSSETEGEFVITGTSGEFSNLPLGYYLVDSNLGALCGLTTTFPDASVNAKNGHPTIDKTVHDKVGDQWVESNSADIGETVDFRTTINVHAGAEKYVLHDVMSQGLTFNEDSVSIKHIVSSSDSHDVPTTMYTVVTENLEDGCTFEIRFSQEFCNTIDTNHRVVVYYSAVLNENAVIAGDGNKNETWLDYGQNHHTTHDNTLTYTYGFDIIKTDTSNNLIDGAEFRIYDALTGGNEIAVVKHESGTSEDGEERVMIYRRAEESEEGETVIVANGAVRVIGLSAGTYYLEEIKAPAGYNQLSGRHRFDISSSNVYATFNADVYSVGSGVQVVNNTGTMLPETGGIGTTLFYVIGGVLVAAAVVLLITKKRMNEK